MRLLLDTGILGKICYPKSRANRPIALWLESQLTKGHIEIVIPEISDYELRRELLHRSIYKVRPEAKDALGRLNLLVGTLDYWPLSTSAMRSAAQIWAEAKGTGQSTEPEKYLGCDIILAAQVREAEGQVITTNEKHLSRFVKVYDWSAETRYG